MIKSVIFSLLLFKTVTSLAQNDSVKLILFLKTNRIQTEKDFIVTINFISFSKNDLFVQRKPLYTVSHSDFGEIKLKLEKLTDVCFQNINVDHDPYGYEFKKDFKRVVYSDTLSYKYDIRNIFYMRKGFYRLKVYYSYLKAEKVFTAESDWFFFEVTTNDYPSPKKIHLN